MSVIRNHFLLTGYRVELHEPPLADALLAALRAVSDQWLSLPPNAYIKEKRFSMGWFDEDYVVTTPIMAVYAPDGTICAFANLVTEYNRNELAIDLLRHRRTVEEGVVDFLLIFLFEWAKAQGYDSCNLGLSPLSGVGKNANDPTVERALYYIYEHANQFYNFKGMHETKEKFHPTWSPRYLAVPSFARLPAVGFTLEIVGSGPDFLLDYATNTLRQLRARWQRRRG